MRNAIFFIFTAAIHKDFNASYFLLIQKYSLCSRFIRVYLFIFEFSARLFATRTQGNSFGNHNDRRRIVHLVHFRFEWVRVRTERACEIVLQFKMKYNNCYKLLQGLFIRNSTLVLGTGSRAQAQFYDPDKKRIDSNTSNKQIGKIR